MAKKATRLLRDAVFEFRKNDVGKALELARDAEDWALRNYQPRLKGQASRLIKAFEKTKERRSQNG